jgi:pimeloyl-ACP methyl ester carboxylesterase
MRLEVRGLAFEVHLGGPDGGPPVLLLHGFPQHSGEWDLVLPRLHAAGLRTVGLDQRGCSPGARPAGVAAYRMAERVADALAVLDALGMPTGHVVGHDWGAVVGWHLAGHHPDRVRSLTAVSVPHPLALAAALAGDQDQQERSAYFQLFRQVGEAERVLLADGGRRLRRLLTGVPPERVDRYLRPLLAPGGLTGHLQWYRAMSGADLAGLGPVSVPTTLVWSDADPAIGRTAALACAGQVAADYRFVELAGVSHWIPEEAPEALADAILARTGA